MIRNHFIRWSRIAFFSFICLAQFWLLTDFAEATIRSLHPSETTDFSGTWSAKLKCPGGNIEFELELVLTQGQYSGHVINGDEKIRIEAVKSSGNQIQIGFPHYDSVIVAKLQNKNELTGSWTKVIGKNKKDQLEFLANKGKRSFSIDGAKKISGRYAVHFESSDDVAVGLFKANGRFLGGTFLTTTGDYRFLAGSFDQPKNIVTLSCFDGGHAFLFRAKIGDKGSLQGDFWSRNSWHEKWTAVKNDKVKLEDGFDQVRWAGVSTATLQFPDLSGKNRSLNDDAFKGKIKIVQVFGSWCPNCHDASLFLNELNNDYGDDGLKIVGLAFELTGDFERDREQILRYKKRTGADYPILIAGLADKATATRQLRILSKVKSYPTTIFLDQDDRPIAIHSGFTGPATGKAYDSLKRRFRKIIEKQLGR